MRLLCGFLALSLCAGTLAATFYETEGNDSKATANAFTMTSGDLISGISTSSTGAGADYFKIQTTPLSLGIYRNRIQITTSGTAGHVGAIRGLTQSDGVIAAGSDSSLQSSSTATTPTRFNQWYSFGKAEQLYYKVYGSSSTTAAYNATLTTTSVTPIAGPAALDPGKPLDLHLRHHQRHRHRVLGL